MRKNWTLHIVCKDFKQNYGEIVFNERQLLQFLKQYISNSYEFRLLDFWTILWLIYFVCWLLKKEIITKFAPNWGGSPLDHRLRFLVYCSVSWTITFDFFKILFKNQLVVYVYIPTLYHKVYIYRQSPIFSSVTKTSF